MKQVTIIAGIGLDKNNKPLSPDAFTQATAAIEHEASRVFGGLTYSRSIGSWVDGEGKIVNEPGSIFTIFTDKPNDVIENFATFVRERYQQSTVVLAIGEVEQRFV